LSDTDRGASTDTTTLIMIILVMLVLFGGGYYGRALVVKQNLRGWTHDSSSPEGALVDAIFAWAKPDSGQKLFRSLEVVRSVQRQGIHSQTKW
jgi:hypothetical protein